MTEGTNDAQQGNKPPDKIISFEAARQRLREDVKPPENTMPGNLGEPKATTAVSASEGQKQSQAADIAEIHMRLQAEQTEKTGQLDPQIRAHQGADKGSGKPTDLAEERQTRDLKWANKLLREKFYNPRRKLTDEEGKRLELLSPGAYEGIKQGDRIRELERQAGGDRKLFDELWAKELLDMKEEGRKRRGGEEVRQRILPKRGESREEINRRLIQLGSNLLTDKQWRLREEMSTKDSASYTKEEWQRWIQNPASVTQEDMKEREEYEEVRQERMIKERKRREAYGWGDEPDDLYDGQYVDIVLESAEKLGLDPRKLTPQERKELRRHYRILTPAERRREKIQNAVYKFKRFITPDKSLIAGKSSGERSVHPEEWRGQPAPEEGLFAFQEWFWSLPREEILRLWEAGQRSGRSDMVSSLYMRESLRRISDEGHQKRDGIVYEFILALIEKGVMMVGKGIKNGVRALGRMREKMKGSNTS